MAGTKAKPYDMMGMKKSKISLIIAIGERGIFFSSPSYLMI